jgi:hypothetical protein
MEKRYALRGFSRQPGFAAIAIGLLALVIGLNTTIFSLVDAVFLKRGPVEHPDELTKADGEQRDFSELIFEQLRLRISGISARPLVLTEATAGVEMSYANSHTHTQRVKASLISGEYSRILIFKPVTSREPALENDQGEEEIAELDECPLRRDKVVISKRIDLKQNVLVIVSLTPGELFGEGPERADDILRRFDRTADGHADDPPDSSALPHEERSSSRAAVRNQSCASLIGKKVETEVEDQGPDNSQTPAPPPERAQERRR